MIIINPVSVKFLSKIQNKLFLFDLKLCYILKTLSLKLKVIFFFLLLIFLISGLLLLFKIDQKLSVETPAAGGTFREGIIGTPRFVNPILAISDADRDLTALIYSGLMRPDGKGDLIPDLAQNYTISKNGLCYTFKLKPNLYWSDNTPLTADDVIFTIKRIQNPLTKSPRRASWEGVEPKKIDKSTIQFCLEKPYAPFIENTTLGILPKHIWQNILPEQMPLSDFNIKPIGSGPYKIKSISRDSSGIITSYTLVPNKNFALKKPYIQNIIFKFYPSEKKLLEAYQSNEIESLSGISPNDILKIKSKNSFLKTYLLPRIFAVFFNQNNAPIFAEKAVKKALKMSVDKEEIVKNILLNFGEPINGPIPPGSFGFYPSKTPQKNIEKAKEILKKDGWKLNKKENVLEKKKNKKEKMRLEFSLSTSNVPDLVKTARLLKKTWSEIGAKVDVKIYEIGDLEQDIIRPRKYDALLFGEITGRDPDPFAFWHSSQRNDPGLNIALYANIKVDRLLEEARTTFDSEEREKKYKEFQKEIEKDIPAIFLYSPHYIYLLPKSLKGANETFISVPSERFSQVFNWYKKTKRVWKVFL